MKMTHLSKTNFHESTGIPQKSSSQFSDTLWASAILGITLSIS